MRKENRRKSNVFDAEYTTHETFRVQSPSVKFVEIEHGLYTGFTTNKDKLLILQVCFSIHFCWLLLFTFIMSEIKKKKL